MLVQNKRSFNIGLLMAISFFVVLAIMFSPVFDGGNAFKASDRLFNSISKGSTYYMPALNEKVQAYKGKPFEVKFDMESEKTAEHTRTILSANGVEVSGDGSNLVVKGDLGVMLEAAVKDSEALFYNRSEELSGRYGIEGRESLYVWWKTLGSIHKALKAEKKFKLLPVIEDVIAKGVEVGYNYYGIEPEKVSTKAGILTFALIFYVVYTLWWGYAIFLMSEGIGLKMTKGSKKEM